MSPPEITSRNPVPHERLAEAGVWIARLHGDARGRAVENGFRRWLRENPENARAFELATEVWDDAENLRRFIPLLPRRRAKLSVGWWSAWAASATLAMALIVAGVVLFQFNQGIATAVGEQRQLVLEDGTRVFLNTATRIVVRYDAQVRRVELKTGEAMFNVAKRPDWPFVVVAGGRQVTALGTSFVVRTDKQRIAVTLMEGKVVVAPESVSAPSPSASGAASSVAQPDNDVFTLTPGQRLTFTTGSATRLDTPSVEKVIAWRRGQVVLDDMPLEAAVAEMNRYSSAKLVIEHPEAADLLINGLFQAGDSRSFANAVAQTHGLEMIERGDEIVLAGLPPNP